jgi:hypothetical protein
MPYLEPRIVVPSRTETGNGNSGQITPQGTGETINLLVRVTAVSGSPQTTFSVEWSNDGTNYASPETADSVSGGTSVSNHVASFERKAKFYRVAWTITGGTPSVTFEISEYMTT